VDDSVDDCRWAAGTSSVDRNGCPDQDGDGTSDLSDGWATPNPNFQSDFVTTSNSDYNDVEYSPDGEFIVTASDDGFVRKWNASTHVNVKSVLGSSGNDDITSVDYSPDGLYVAAGLDDSGDSVHIYHASNLTSVYGAISADVGSGDYINDVEFSPDSSLLAVSIGRSGNGGTNGRVLLVDVSDGSVLNQFLNPNNEDRFYDAEFSPDGELIALAGNGDIYISNVSSGATVYTITSPPESVNALSWSPDGNYIAMCGGWEGGGASFDMYKFVSNSWSRLWEKGTTTSCASTDFSHDSSQVVAGMYWYGADGNTAKVYQTDSGAFVTHSDALNTTVAHRAETITEAAVKFLALHGVRTTPTLCLRTAEATRVCTTGSLILMKTTMATTRPTKVMVSSMHSRVREVSGLIQITTDTAITAFTTTIPMLRHLTRPPSNPIHAQQYQERQPKTDLVVLMGMEMAGLMKAIFTQPTSCNGQTVTGMALVTIITLT
jgi:WD40 repeat protein